MDPQPVNVSWKLTGMFLFVICIISIIGFVIPMASTGDLHSQGFPPDMVLKVVMWSMAGAVAIDALLVWLLLHLIKLSNPVSRPADMREQKVVARKPAQLDAPPLSVPSATEHTTRNFDMPFDRESGARR
jgi:hypothetical protein